MLRLLVLSVLLCSVSATFGNKSLQLLYDYTNYMTTSHKYDAFIVLRPGGLLELPDLEQSLQRQFSMPLVTLCGKKQMRLCEFIGANVLAIVLMPNVAYFDQDVRDFGMVDRHGITMVFIAVEMPPINRQELQSFFSWCWQLNILNTVMMFETNEAVRVFSYSPFPVFHLYNLTGASFAHYHREKLRDLHGFVFNVRIFNDPPMVLYAGRPSRRQLTGIAGLLFSEYVRHMNATYNVEMERGAVEATRERNALLAPSRKLTHIGINPYTTAVDFAKGIKASYPIFLTKVCVVVPVLPELPPCEYLPMVFQLLTPYILLVGLVIVIVLHRLLNCAQAPIYGHIEFGVFLNNVIKSVLSQAVTKRATDSGAHKAILLLIAAFGIIWTNSIVAMLTSFFTAQVPNKQIVTVQDFMDSCFQIMVHEYDRLMYFESHLLPDELRSRLYVVDSRTNSRYRAELNTSYAYVASSIKWNHMNLRQRRLWRLRHTVASDELCSPILPESWPLQQDSPFEDSLKVFTLRAHSYGLLEKFEWISGSGMQWFSQVFCDDYESVEPLTFEHLLMAFSLLGLGAFVGCVTLIGELLVHRFKEHGTLWRRTPAKA